MPTFSAPLLESETRARDDIHAALCRAYGVDPTRTRHIPVDNPVSMDLSNVGLLKENEYFATYKADGIRNLLVLTMTIIDGDYQPIAALVDRAGQMSLVDIIANLNYFEDETVMDGELCYIEKENCTEFLVFNWLSGRKDLYMENYTRRLELMGRSVTESRIEVDRREDMAKLGYIVARNSNLFICRKKVELAKNLRNMTRRFAHSYKTDGFIFTPNSRVIPGRQLNLLKWKTDNTIDVLVRCRFNYDTQVWGGLEVLVDECGTMVDLGTAITTINVTFDTASETFQDMLAGFLDYHMIFDSKLDMDATESDDFNPTFCCVVEVSCHCLGDGFVLTMERLRPDKSGPNNSVTVERTIKTICDNINMNQIYEAIDVFYSARNDMFD